MTLKDWDAIPFTAIDCVRDHNEWNDMVDYIKHSGSCANGDGYTLYDNDTSSNIWFEFYEHSIDFKEDRAIYINDDETYIGHGAGDNIVAGTNNTLVGHDAGQANDVSGCVLFGYQAGKNNTQDNIVAIGRNALFSNAGVNNVGIGYAALDDACTGGYNTAIGNLALSDNGGGNNNTACGYNSLNTNVDGLYNTGIGSNAGGNAAVGLDSCVYLGYSSGENNAASNRLYINNSNSVFPLIYGEFDNNVVSFGDNTGDFFFKFSIAAVTSTLSGGGVAGDNLMIKANAAQSFPYVYLNGGASVHISATGGSKIYLREGHTDFLGFYENGTDEIIEGQTANNDLFLFPNGTGVLKWGTETTNAGSARGELIKMKTAAGTTVYLKTYDLV
jgi:hypothetical protein